jgi:hypothetical protein
MEDPLYCFTGREKERLLRIICIKTLKRIKGGKY